MKITTLLVIVALLSLLPGHTSRAQETPRDSVTMHLSNETVDRVLEVYQGFAKTDLVIASNVQTVSRRITLHATAVSQDSALHTIQQALLTQAGIILTRLSDKRTSVTYNDQLKVTP